MKKKLHRTGSTILLALAPAAALGVVGGIIVANLPKSEAQPIVDPSMSGEVDIEVTTDGRGYTECKLTSKDETKQVASVVVIKGGVTLEETEYEWNKEGQYVSISPDVMEQYPGQVVITPTLEDKETIQEKWFKEYKIINDSYLSSITTFDNDEVTIKIGDKTPTVLGINNFVYGGNRMTCLDLLFDAQTSSSDYYLSTPTCDEFKEYVKNAEDKGFTCTFGIEDKYLSIIIPGASDTYTKYVIDRYGYILEYESKNSSGNITTFTAEYASKPHLVTAFVINWAKSSTFSPGMQLRPDTEYTITTNNYPDSAECLRCSLCKAFAQDTKYPLSSVNVTGLDDGITWSWDSTNNIILFSGRTKVQNIKITFKLDSSLEKVDDGWFRLNPNDA